MSRSAIKRLEVGLPSALLRSVEILDFPGSANVLLPAASQDHAGYGMDARSGHRLLRRLGVNRSGLVGGVAEAIRSRSVLAVTFCDVIAGENGFKRLHARLEKSARPYFC